MSRKDNEHRPRNSLTKDQALAIFKRRPHSFREINTAALAKEFSVTAKTVRDIWIGRTWYKDTLFLEPSRTDAFERLTRRIGRPKGSRDTKPRMRRDDWPCKDKRKQIGADRWNPLAESLEEKPAFILRDEKLCRQKCSENVDEAVFRVSCTDILFSDPFHNDWPCWPSA
jgi:hypothetical protein